MVLAERLPFHLPLVAGRATAPGHSPRGDGVATRRAEPPSQQRRRDRGRRAFARPGERDRRQPERRGRARTECSARPGEDRRQVATGPGLHPGQSSRVMRILVLAPHPFLQARGTPLAVRQVLEFLSARGHTVDLLTYHEGDDVAIRNCRVHRIPRVWGISNVRPGFSLKKLVCDALMFVECLRLVRRTRYDLIHAVEESAFIAAAARAISGLPYVYDMDSSLAEQMVEAYPALDFTLPFLRYCEAVAVRHSLGVLTVCAALEDVVLGHDPAKPVGRVVDTTLLPEGAPAQSGLCR